MNRKKIINFFESITTIMIILVVVQTFLEDFSVVISSNWEFVFAVKLSAFVFDLYFTIEFLTRLFSAVVQKRQGKYFFKENGWIDLIASIPLLVFVSGPYFAMFALDIEATSIAALSSFSTIKIIKVIRVARILRLLRILKISSTVKNADSIMNQRHINYILTMFIMTIISFSFANSLLKSFSFIESSEQQALDFYQFKTEEIARLIIDENATFNKLPEKFKEDIISVTSNEIEIYSENKWSEEEKLYHFTFTQESIMTFSSDKYPTFEIMFYISKVRIAEATHSLSNLILILIIVFLIVFVYSRHFAKTVTDPIFVMRNGFENMQYTLAVKIPEEYADDDIFKLADDYNKRWLPAKVRKLEEKNAPPNKLSLKDLF